jgi:hypothetical protein
MAKDRIISNNGACFLKELILRRDPSVKLLLERFERQASGDAIFLDKINDLIEQESMSLYGEIFAGTSLEMGKANFCIIIICNSTSVIITINYFTFYWLILFRKNFVERGT